MVYPPVISSMASWKIRKKSIVNDDSCLTQTSSSGSDVPLPANVWKPGGKSRQEGHLGDFDGFDGFCSFIFNQLSGAKGSVPSATTAGRFLSLAGDGEMMWFKLHKTKKRPEGAPNKIFRLVSN